MTGMTLNNGAGALAERYAPFLWSVNSSKNPHESLGITWKAKKMSKVFALTWHWHSQGMAKVLQNSVGILNTRDNG